MPIIDVLTSLSKLTHLMRNHFQVPLLSSPLYSSCLIRLEFLEMLLSGDLGIVCILSLWTVEVICRVMVLYHKLMLVIFPKFIVVLYNTWFRYQSL